MANLEQYRAKRNFRITSEPAGKRRRKDTTPDLAFVIHKHDATRLHYDLRLEHGGVLWSWAVTRGPSLDPSEKRLAVHVEDHPLDYASFEGVIPAKQYGAGPVIVWDRGTWEPEGDPAADLKKGHLRFELRGEKLHGAWHLVRLRPRGGEKRDNWLLIKSKDEFATTKGDILEDEPRSVKSGLTIEDVAKGKKGNGKAKAKTATRQTAAKTKSRGEGLPDFVSPCLARLESAPPVGDHWLHEVKFDGYRMQARIEDGKVTLKTRTGLDWTDRFGPDISKALAELDCETALIDGEIVVPDEKGGSSFSALQLDLSERRTSRMIYYVFDLLHLDGEDMTGEPLLHRKEKLRDLLSGEELGPVRYSEHFDEPGKVVLEHACRMGLEGVVSKRADARYRSGRGFDWIKSKCTLRQEFIVTGYVPSDKSGRDLRSLVVGYRENDRLKPAGHVGTGFSQRNAKGLKKKLDTLRTDKSAYEGAAGRERRVVWVKPELVAEIEFRSWTRGGNIRHASFQGLREDKPASEVVMERPDSETKAGEDSPPSRGKTGGRRARAVTKVALSNPDKKLWPEEGVSKQDLLAYYTMVWPRMERYVVNRPLALVRAPDGVGKQRFFQKHASAGMHDAIGTMKDPEDGEELLFIRDFDGLAGLVQLGVVEIHIWGATIDKIEHPDQIVFDLDPDEGLDVDDVRRAALEVKEKLDDLGLPNFVKTSGGKGFHAMVPLKPKADWAAVKGFAHDFARAMAEAAPDRYTATLSKKARKGRIFIDYLRNGRGSTTVAPYSSRAKKGATVSLPITWKMVADGVGPAAFTIDGVETSARLKAADPWKDFFERGRTLERR
ncbi:DNA ligase D [Mesorhizobium sp. 1B3]|uniref:DNA ligase D n=1 Tax=Mesorhizobium sp. 1B3 TaxID=3243599 RepID=UPI003D96FAAD